MHGNVWEWCLDHWHGGYEDAPEDGLAWLNSDAEENAPRVLRGGSWYFDPASCRSASRTWNNADDRSDDVGFRLVSPARILP
jgi:formylglycine-generating enzyme required for sulfatase activity